MPLTNFPNGITAEGIYTKGVGYDVVATTAAVMSNNLVAFNVTGPVEIYSLVSICQTANNATASTLQWTSTGTLGTTTATITGASATLASATAGTTVVVPGTALATAPVINANGVGIVNDPDSIVVPAGTLKLTIGVGSTTGTWIHYLRYAALSPTAVVTAAF